MSAGDRAELVVSERALDSRSIVYGAQASVGGGEERSSDGQVKRGSRKGWRRRVDELKVLGDTGECIRGWEAIMVRSSASWPIGRRMASCPKKVLPLPAYPGNGGDDKLAPFCTESARYSLPRCCDSRASKEEEHASPPLLSHSRSLLHPALPVIVQNHCKPCPDLRHQLPQLSP